MGTTEKAAPSRKARVDESLALHRELNPQRGLAILIAIDRLSGQLFFCARRGSVLRRLEKARERDPDGWYYAEIAARRALAAESRQEHASPR